jgi:hypothetical protein
MPLLSLEGSKAALIGHVREEGSGERERARGSREGGPAPWNPTIVMFQPKGCCLNSARHFECPVVTRFFHLFPPPSSNEKVCVGGNILDCVMSAPGTNYGVDCAHGSSFSSD